MKALNGGNKLWIGLLVVGLSVAGCSANDRDLPTISGETASAKTLESIAQSFSDCMTASGVSVVIMPNQTKEMTVVQPAGYASYMYRFASGSGMSFNVDDKVQDEFFSRENTVPGEAKPALLLDGVDHSDVFAMCVGQSGYSYAKATHNETPPIPAEEMQAQVDANNRWTACVRENGFADVADTSVPENNREYVWFPRVTLPLDMTVEQLQMLIGKCPIVTDEYAELSKKMRQWYADHPKGGNYPGDQVSVAMIEFKASSETTLTPEEATHREELRDVISEHYKSRMQ